ncbi:unnamed protein product [Acanthosepion pharaonis]|uniref:Endonuclease/exonuclease/phosphatase domain-containing protein n=1 Tax=Acanthosepion pharaonis TaxID=158019 RepID=A0A812D641_ACAPH|nr:unnamed protein product [Sepia pharaonis]
MADHHSVDSSTLLITPIFSILMSSFLPKFQPLLTVRRGCLISELDYLDDPSCGLLELEETQALTAHALHQYKGRCGLPLGNHGHTSIKRYQANKALLAWKPVSPRLARVRLRGALFNISIIAVYAPTLDADEVTKDVFYDSLQTVMNGISPRDFVVIAGDFNARTGTGDANNRHIVGPFAIGDRCSNGERLIDFAAANRLTVSSTRFQHLRRHLVTWYSNDGVLGTKSIISSSSHGGPRVSWTVAHSGEPKQAMSMAPTMSSFVQRCAFA